MKRETTLTRSLMLALTGALIAFWLLAIGLSIQVMRHEFDEVFDSTLQETGERLLAVIIDDVQMRKQIDPDMLSRPRTSGNQEYLTYQVRDREGRLMFKSADAPDQPFEAPLQRGFSETKTHRFYTDVSLDGALFLQVADRFSNRREAVRESAVTMLIPLIILIPVSILAIWWIVGRALRPIDVLRQAISTKDGGNMAPVDSDMLPKELKPITHSVNLLLDRLRRAFEAEREFTANSAHELRTPIAGALAQTQRLIEELPDETSKQRAVNVETSLVNLGRLAEKLLQLARADSGIGTRTTETDIRRIFEMVVSDFEKDTAVAGRLRYDDGDGDGDGASVDRQVDVDAFGIVIRNLIENALIHSLPATPVLLSMDTEGTVRVINDSPVVAPADLAALKTRFHRNAATTVSGSGLGLAIADRLATQMRGHLTLSSPASGRDSGFEARLDMPR